MKNMKIIEKPENHEQHENHENPDNHENHAKHENHENHEKHENHRKQGKQVLGVLGFRRTPFSFSEAGCRDSAEMDPRRAVYSHGWGVSSIFYEPALQIISKHRK